jgi:hypothetical protein
LAQWPWAPWAGACPGLPRNRAGSRRATGPCGC